MKGRNVLKKSMIFIISIVIVSCQIFGTTFGNLSEEELFTVAPIVVVAQCRGSIPGAARFLVFESLRGKLSKYDEISVNTYSATPGYYYLMTLWPNTELPVQRMANYSSTVFTDDYNLALCQYRKPKIHGIYGLTKKRKEYRFDSEYQPLQSSFNDVRKWTSQKVIIDYKRYKKIDLDSKKISGVIKRFIKKGKEILSSAAMNKMRLEDWLMSFSLIGELSEKKSREICEQLKELQSKYRRKLDSTINYKFNLALAFLGDRSSGKKSIAQFQNVLPEMFVKSESKRQADNHRELEMILVTLFNKFPDLLFNMITKLKKPKWYNQRFWDGFSVLLASNAGKYQRKLLKCKLPPVFLAAAIWQAEKNINSVLSLKQYYQRIKKLAQSKILDEKIKAIRLLLAVGSKDACQSLLELMEKYGKGKSHEQYNRGSRGRKGYKDALHYMELKNTQAARWAYLFFASLSMYKSVRPVIADSYDYKKYPWVCGEYQKWWEKYGKSISPEKLYHAAFPVTRVKKK